MTPLELANSYMESFFSSKNFDNLYSIFSENFSFIGPLYRFNSADEYITSLKTDPPENCSYQMLKSYQDVNSACLVYRFFKNNIQSTMVQLFKIENDRISRIELIFDSADFH